jgi:hypothetical protein
MANQFSASVRNAILDAIETTIGTAPLLRIRTGAQPANCAAARTGTILAELTLPSDWLAAASGGTKSKSGLWEVAAIATGTAAHFEIMDSGGTVCHHQGSVTATGGGGDVTVASVSITSGITVTFSSFVLTAPGA